MNTPNKIKLKDIVIGFKLGAMPKTKKFMIPGKHYKRGPYWFDHYNEDLLAQIRDYKRRNT